MEGVLTELTDQLEQARVKSRIISCTFQRTLEYYAPFLSPRAMLYDVGYYYSTGTIDRFYPFSGVTVKFDGGRGAVLIDAYDSEKPEEYSSDNIKMAVLSVMYKLNVRSVCCCHCERCEDQL
jgi:hypothetical protein